MAKTSTTSAIDGVELLIKTIELSLVEYMAITRCESDIENYLGRYISKFSTALPGAFSRKTMVHPLAGSEIDMLVLFGEEHSKRFVPSELLHKLHVTLEDRYPGTEYQRSRMCVRVPIEEFSFLVRPGFLTEKNLYLVPSSFVDDWTRYDALDYRSRFLVRDNALSGRLKHVVWLLKTWNRATGHMFNGYYLELLVWDCLKDDPIESYAAGLRYIFRKALSEVVFRKEDPGSVDIEIEGLVDIEDVVNAMHQFHAAYRTTHRIVELEEEGDFTAANLLWRKLFPGCFPSDMDMKIGGARQAGLKGAEALKSLVK